ncbi:hypothetical protein [Kocuria tytonis]|uniref:Uncharacterized protein n=1 Tax=Kocuria tytonis TaxID=2054280 RepID=A0A495A5T8_9MICC|nr:hypothetical protein [Kocuria tytonis]RKQ35044.1 hypothetical protein C1C97_007155 [Kocuria tytonis]
MPNYNLDVTVVRGDRRMACKAMDLNTMYTFPLDTDTEERDLVECLLPNGKVRTVRITKVDFLQSPYRQRYGSMPGSLDHIEAHYSTQLVEPAPIDPGHTWHVNAANMQVATGDHSNQTLNVGSTPTELLAVAQGIIALTRTINPEIVDDDADQWDDRVADALEKGAVRTLEEFRDWAIDCVKQTGSAAVVPAMTMLMNQFLHQVMLMAH